ncbi:MAG: UDP-3-O-(3-hydroxymyristoyl)glucosamine N-acyltransferase, partial [Halanaerobiales bacterium]|nr:UDP-3-O-(3-hydroxymyristoyl)glucosamine N-acyltransferase [Halanaerobiales bacterium]
MEYEKKPSYTIKEIIKLLDADYKGKLNLDHKIKDVSNVEKNDINSLTFAENKSYIDKAVKNAKGLVLVNRDLDADLIQNVLYVNNARLAYAKVAQLFKKTPYYCPGIDKNATISDSVKLGQNVSIHSNVVIRENVKIGDNTILAPGTVVDKDVKIGKNCLIYSNVVLERGCEIKDNVTINSLSVIGAEGYGYVSDKSKHHHIPQLGNVVINNDVDIGANVTIDRGTQDSTVIGAGTKIDNQV